MNISARLKRLEDYAGRHIMILFPSDDDGFISALVGDHAKEYRRGDGYDVMKALSDTAEKDWIQTF